MLAFLREVGPPTLFELFELQYFVDIAYFFEVFFGATC